MNGRNRKLRLNLKSGFILPLALTVPALTMAGEVTLTGEGSVRYEPDSARLQFTASAEHELPQKATERVAALMAQWREGRGRRTERRAARVHRSCCWDGAPSEPSRPSWR